MMHSLAWRLTEFFAVLCNMVRRAHNLGYEIWMDLFADLKHQGIYVFDGDFAKSFVVQIPE